MGNARSISVKQRRSAYFQRIELERIELALAAFQLRNIGLDGLLVGIEYGIELAVNLTDYIHFTVDRVQELLERQAAGGVVFLARGRIGVHAGLLDTRETQVVGYLLHDLKNIVLRLHIRLVQHDIQRLCAERRGLDVGLVDGPGRVKADDPDQRRGLIDQGGCSATVGGCGPTRGTRIVAGRIDDAQVAEQLRVSAVVINITEQAAVDTPSAQCVWRLRCSSLLEGGMPQRAPSAQHIAREGR